MEMNWWVTSIVGQDGDKDEIITTIREQFTNQCDDTLVINVRAAEYFGDQIFIRKFSRIFTSSDKTYTTFASS